LGPLPPPP